MDRSYRARYKNIEPDAEMAEILDAASFGYGAAGFVYEEERKKILKRYPNFRDLPGAIDECEGDEKALAGLSKDKRYLAKTLCPAWQKKLGNISKIVIGTRYNLTKKAFSESEIDAVLIDVQSLVTDLGSRMVETL